MPPIEKYAAEGAFDSSQPIPTWAQWSAGQSSNAGVRVNRSGAYGIPTYFRGVRLISETIASMDLQVERNEVDQPDSPAQRLLSNPVPRDSSLKITRFDVLSYIGASLIDWGNAFLLKARANGRIIGLYPLDPSRVRIDHTAGGHEYYLQQPGMAGETLLDPADVIHIASFHGDLPCCGVSVIAAVKEMLGVQIGRQQFEGRFIANDATPSNILTHPGNPNEQQRTVMRNEWNRRHGGSGNSGRTGVLFGGWDVKQLPVNLQQAQFIESQQFGVQDIARALGIPSGMLDDTLGQRGVSVEDENRRFLQFGLLPWMRRIEDGLAYDEELFPGDGWCVEFNTEDLLRPSIATLGEFWLRMRQAGVLLADEIRSDLGKPPLPDGAGQQVQITPVGGAPNLQPQPQPASNNGTIGTDA